MIELPDDELDKLFRKSSEELEPSYEPEDWGALRKRMDQEDGRTPAAWLRKWWPVGILIFLIPVGWGGYYLLNGSDSDKKLVVNAPVSENVPSPSVLPDQFAKANTKENLKSKEHAVRSGDKPENDPTEKENISGIENGGENRLAEALKSKAVIRDNIDINDLESSKALPRSRSKSGGVYLDPNHSKGKEGDGAFSSRNQIAVKEKVKTGAVNVNSADDEIKVPLTANTVSGQVESRLLLSVALINPLPFNNKVNSRLPAINADEQVVEVKTPAEPKSKEPSPKMAIRVGYSPDLSTVGLKNFSKPGSSFSLMVEYGLLPRFYIQAGIVRSVKDYSAKAGEYKLMPYVTQINTPYDVDGTCNMFEVPLGFRYDLTQTAHSRWFAGTGFTSYYVQKEKYIYNYDTYVHGQKSGWEGKTGWFWLSHINASVGYERRISNKLSLLAEPFIRIPVKGVGYGKVNLITTGMWLSVRYTPYFFKK